MTEASIIQLVMAAGAGLATAFGGMAVWVQKYINKQEDRAVKREEASAAERERLGQRVDTLEDRQFGQLSEMVKTTTEALKGSNSGLRDLADAVSKRPCMMDAEATRKLHKMFPLGEVK